MNTAIYKKLKCELDKGKKAVVVTLLNEGDGEKGVSQSKIILTEEQAETSRTIDFLGAEIAAQVRNALENGSTEYFCGDGGLQVLIEPYFPQPRLIILGGGAIAKPLAEFAAKAGFLISVADDRPMFANKDRFPEAERVICDDFSDVFAQLDLNEYAFVVIVTREHRHDLECLRQALKHRTAYTGMIGSKSSVKSLTQKLLEEGCTQDQISGIYAPIGIEIGADTPEEIAISIMAQIIARRRLALIPTDDGPEAQKISWPEIEKTVLEELSKDARDARAVVTIVETTGSVPRKAGTKMVVWSYGMTLGSIGGGYAEGEAINAAWQVIGSGRFAIHAIDMSGQNAEEEGMVCGGSMKILIEDCGE